MFIPDTNILIDYGKVEAVRARLESAARNGVEFAIAPPTLTELARGMIASGEKTFGTDKNIFSWLAERGFPILELPRPFMAKLLGAPVKSSGVEPKHYAELIKIIAGSANFAEFLKLSQTPDGVWRDIDRADAIHGAQLDKEHDALLKLAKTGHGRLAAALANQFGAPGGRPSADLVGSMFSAAIEFLESSMSKVSSGANTRKNDPGLYIDFQLLFYLGDENAIFLTRENFGNEIRNSPQRSRIVALDGLPQ
jgi:hypothetical protein